MNFINLVGEPLAEALKKQGITEPTPVHSQVIPLALNKKSLIASAETGSGKTLAYLLPLYSAITIGIKKPQAIVLAPTHELAAQIFKQAEILTQNLNSGIFPALLIGGASITRQLEKIKEKPRLIIGSAGRILELISMGKLSVHKVKTIVLDEADRLLSDSQSGDIKTLISKTLRDRKLWFFSASISPEQARAAQLLAPDVETVQISGRQIPLNIQHFFIECEKRDKVTVLRKILHSSGVQKTLVFVNNQNDMDILAEKLKFHAVSCAAISGSVLKNDRRNALAAFREGRITALISSDLASRGLDIPGITHVIMADLPDDPDIYLHRAGRAGRMNRPGTVIVIVEKIDMPKLKKFEKEFSVKITETEISFGKMTEKQ